MLYVISDGPVRNPMCLYVTHRTHKHTSNYHRIASHLFKRRPNAMNLLPSTLYSRFGCCSRSFHTRSAMTLFICSYVFHVDTYDTCTLHKIIRVSQRSIRIHMKYLGFSRGSMMGLVGLGWGTCVFFWRREGTSWKKKVHPCC